jgi:hypothetical protein
MEIQGRLKQPQKRFFYVTLILVAPINRTFSNKIGLPLHVTYIIAATAADCQVAGNQEQGGLP